MSLAKASVWTAASTLVKIGAGLLVVKLLAVSFGPSGVGLAGNFRQLVTVLGVLAGAGIFNGVTKWLRSIMMMRLSCAGWWAPLRRWCWVFNAAGACLSAGGGAHQPGAVRPYPLSGAGAAGGAGADGDCLGEPAAGADERLSRCGG
jgi:antigen flippase